LKLHILNLGHSVLADKWLEESRPELETVREILAEADNRDHLRSIYQNEIVPGFAAHGMGSEAERYMQTTIERFLNPTLNHRLRDISSNHKEKIRRRIIDFIDWAAEAGDTGEKPELARIVTRNGLWKE
jgi:tagaturonate reductase